MIDVVIVNWNAGAFLESCVASVVGHGEGCVASLTVVDNASSDGSERFLQTRRDADLIRAGANLGFGKACNLGAKAGEAPYILFLNPDARLFPGTLTAALDFLTSAAGRSAAICGVQLIDEDGFVSRTCSRLPSVSNQIARASGLDKLIARWGPRMVEWDHKDTRVVEQVMGAFFLVRRSVFEPLGGFDERFFVYYEEVDFSQRAKAAGWESGFLAGAQAFHHGGGASDQIRARRLFYSLRSRLKYARKHFGPMGFAAVALATLLVEPLARGALSLICGRLGELGEMAGGYRLLLTSGARRVFSISAAAGDA